MMKRLLIIPDCHRPFHDHNAWQLMINCGRQLFKNVPTKDRVIITLGDFLDFEKVSFHPKDPRKRLSFADEIADGNVGLDALDSFNADTKFFVEGNHEVRLCRHIMEKTPEFLGLPGMSVPELLRLKERKWRFVPYRTHYKLGKLYMTHECGNAGPLAGIKARETFGHSVIMGHNHAMTAGYAGNAVGEQHFGMTFGWLGNVDLIDYMHKVQAAKWIHGIGVGFMEANGNVHIQQVPFVQGRAVVDGKLVTL